MCVRNFIIANPDYLLLYNGKRYINFALEHIEKTAQTFINTKTGRLAIGDFMQKKGAAAAALIGIITLLLIFWILFLPPAEREKLLAENATQTGGRPPVVRNATILSAPVGHLAAAGPPAADHPIPNLYLFEATQAQVLANLPPFAVKNAWFDKADKSITFSIPNLQLSNNIALSYRALVRKGRLSIALNGASLFDDAVLVENPPPLSLPKGLLQADQNVLTFHVSGVGPAFWRTNEYRIEAGQVIGDVVDISKQQATASFAIDSEEYYNLDRAYLHFWADCEQRSMGSVQILLNNRNVYNAIPDCGTVNRQDIFATDLNIGKNTLTFALTEGNVRIEQVKVRTEMKPVKSFLSFFTVDRVLWDELQSGISRVILDVRFVDDGSQKAAIMNVNGRLDTIDQRLPSFSRDISSILQPGNNYIEIVPRTELNIVTVEVRVE